MTDCFLIKIIHIQFWIAQIYRFYFANVFIVIYIKLFMLRLSLTMMKMMKSQVGCSS